MKRRVPAAIVAFVAVVLAVLALGSGHALAATRANGVSISYKAGWNLVGGPDGTVFNGSSSMYTFGEGAAAYQTSAGSDQTTGGKGYWAYYPADTTVTLNGAGASSQRLALPAGQYIMIGNPSGVQTVTVSGADQVLTYDPGTGSFSNSTTLSIGQGAWVFSNNGGTLTLTATGTTLAIPTTPPPAAATNNGGGQSSGGSGSGGSSSGAAISLTYQGQSNNVNGLPSGAHAYIFTVSGFKTSDYTLDQLGNGISLTGPQGNVNDFYLGTSRSDSSIFLIGLPGGLPQGTYTVTLVLPDGRSAKASFPGGG